MSSNSNFLAKKTYVVAREKLNNPRQHKIGNQSHWSHSRRQALFGFTWFKVKWVRPIFVDKNGSDPK